MLHINDAKRSLKVDVAISTEMQAAIDQWAMMFIDRAPWLDDTTQSLGLPAAIAGEIARLTTVELESSITGSARADYLQGEYERVLNELRSQVETAAAGGVQTLCGRRADCCGLCSGVALSADGVQQPR